MRASWLALMAVGCLAVVGSEPDATPTDSPPGQPDDVAVPIFLTGGERGALEPCGCASGQLGGLARRATVLAIERPAPDAALTLSCGGLLRDTRPLDALILETAMQALAAMSYDAHVPSSRALSLGRASIERSQGAGVPWLAANVTSTQAEKPTGMAPMFEKTISGRTVTVIGLVLPDEPLPTDYVIGDPLAALKASNPEPGSDLVIVVSGSVSRVRKLMAEADEAWAEALILVGDPYGGPTTRPLDGRILSAGQRGHFMLVAKAGHAHDAPRVLPLDESWPPDPSMGVLVGIHRQRIVMEGLLDDLYEQIAPPGGQTYVGPEACSGCHAAAFSAYAGTRHSHAIQSLVPDQRFLDPDCLTCHSTAFGLKSGYAGLEQTPDFARVGCESCHGPGSEHVSSPFLKKMSKQVHCITCHDSENSPAFDRAVYWPRIQHGL